MYNLKFKIVITGGHLTPAQAVIEELKKKGNWEIYYFGRRFSLEGKSFPSAESLVIPKMGVKFISLPAGRLQRKFSRYTPISLLRIPLSFLIALGWLVKIKPAVILSFGGYVSVPAVVAGWLLRIPVLTHEQTVVSGFANKIDGFFAKKILVSFPESLGDFPPGKVVLTGNPIRKEVFQLRIANCRPWPASPWLERGERASPLAGELRISQEPLPLIYITGGSQGSQIINQAVVEVLPELLKKYRIIHQCGKLDYQQLTAYSLQLTARLRKRYWLIDYVGLNDIGWVLNRADLVISRAGANTITELAALGKPAILIPIPWTSGREQEKNARMLVEAGTAVILPQEELSGPKLLKTINSMISNLEKFRANAWKAREKIKLDADKRIVQEIKNVLAEK